MLLQLALAEEALAETHLIHITLDFCDEILYAFCASGTVFLDSLTELVAAQFHIVEIRDGFAETVGDIGELSLELSEGLACVIRTFWVYCLLGDGTRNEDGNAPVLLVFVFYIGLAVARLDEGENLAVDIVSALFFELLKKAGARNIKEYNQKYVNHRLKLTDGHEFMPYIVVIIDEFGDLIMTAGKEVELPIARIAQLARAVGIHMIIATQRPTTSIITGNIKANFPGRIAFKVTSAIDSKTILDRTGANQLIGRGDMLYLNGNEPVRVQCAFVDTPEIERINEYICNQPGPIEPMELPEPASEDGGVGGNGSVDARNLDPYFEEAAHAIVLSQQGSTSMIQRRFSIGYNRAGRLMDQLEAAGIVGAAQGSKPREVLLQDENQLNTLLIQLRNS
jgi:hypothetical protein